MSASRPEPTFAAERRLRLDQPRARREGVVERAERARRREVRGGDDRHDDRPVAADRAAADEERDDDHRDRHQHDRPRHGREGADDEDRRPPRPRRAPAGASRREPRSTRRSGRRASAPPPARSDAAPRPRTRSRAPRCGVLRDPGRLEEREPVVQVVEDVVVRPRLVDRRERDHDAADDERAEHDLDRADAADGRADEQVRDDEAEEVGQRLDRRRLEARLGGRLRVGERRRAIRRRRAARPASRIRQPRSCACRRAIP